MRHHLAQINVGRPIAPIDSPQMAGFVALLPELNALADASPGFVWRLTDDGGADATSLRPYGDDIMVNMSVWESVEALREYTYRSAHLEPLRRRREWFLPYGEPMLALWWVPAGTIPTLHDGVARLALLAEHGPGPDSFTFRVPYPAPANGAGRGRDASSEPARSDQEAASTVA
jgi:hypothetical protein